MLRGFVIRVVFFMFTRASTRCGSTVLTIFRVTFSDVGTPLQHLVVRPLAAEPWLRLPLPTGTMGRRRQRGLVPREIMRSHRSGASSASPMSCGRRWWVGRFLGPTEDRHFQLVRSWLGSVREDGHVTEEEVRLRELNASLVFEPLSVTASRDPSIFGSTADLRTLHVH